MKLSNILLILVLLFNITSILAFEVKPGWGEDFTPQVHFICKNDESTYCRDLCGEEKICKIKEDYCRDCAGTNLTLREVFLEVGDKYETKDFPVRIIELIDFLRDGNFISLTSKSIYNFVDYYDSIQVRTQFQALCKNDDYPVIFMSVDPYSRILDELKYVVCKNQYDDRTIIYNLEIKRPFVPLPVYYSED